MAATSLPLALFHDLIVGTRPPFVKWGFGLVVLYGPVVLLPVWPGGGPEGAGALVALLAYELMSTVVVAAYVLAWRLGDAWLGDAAHPRVARRRWALPLLGLASVLWLAYVAHVSLKDACLDAGGAMGGPWSCRGAD